MPEYLQEDVRPYALGPAVLAQLEREDRAELIATFTEIHHTLRRDASARAADAILALQQQRGAR